MNNAKSCASIGLGCHLQIIILPMLATKYTFYNELSWLVVSTPLILVSCGHSFQYMEK